MRRRRYFIKKRLEGEMSGQGDLTSLSRDDLIKKARDAGLSGLVYGWTDETIIKKLKELNNG